MIRNIDCRRNSFPPKKSNKWQLGSCLLKNISVNSTPKIVSHITVWNKRALYIIFSFQIISNYMYNGTVWGNWQVISCYDQRKYPIQILATQFIDFLYNYSRLGELFGCEKVNTRNWQYFTCDLTPDRASETNSMVHCEASECFSSLPSLSSFRDLKLCRYSSRAFSS